MNPQELGKKIDHYSVPLTRILSQLVQGVFLSAGVSYAFYLILPNVQLAICQFLFLLIICLRNSLADEAGNRALATQEPEIVNVKVKTGRGRPKLEWRDIDGEVSAVLATTPAQKAQVEQLAGPVEALIYTDQSKAVTALRMPGFQLTPRLFSHSSLRPTKWYSVTNVLIAANCIYYLMAANFNLAYLEKLPTPMMVSAGASVCVIEQPWRLFASSFLHLSWWHLFFNMLALILFGRICEAKLGATRYLALYLFCALGSSVASAALFAGTAPSAGASGAILGLGGFITVMAYFRRDLYRSTVVRRILISKSEIAIGALLVGLVCSSILDGVKTDNGAHLGGFVFGFIGAWIFPSGKIRTRLTAALAALALMGGLWYVANQRYYDGEIHEARGTLAVCREDWPVAYTELVQALDYNNRIEREKRSSNASFDVGQTICSLLGISSKGKVASLYNDASWAASAQGKYGDALTLASKGLAIETGPGQLDTRAVAYLGLKDYKAAAKDLQDVLKIAPHYPEALFHLAQLRLLENNAVGTGEMSKKYSFQPEEWEYRFGRP